MSELHPDPCHYGNTIRYGDHSSDPQLEVELEPPRVRFFKAVFVPNRESLSLGLPEEQELLIALMGLGTVHSVQAFHKDPAAAMASQRRLQEHLGITNWHEAPPLLFETGKMRILKQRSRFPAGELTNEEQKIIRYLSTGITNKGISTVLNIPGELLEKTIAEIIARSGVHNLTGLKTMGWLSGLAIGSMQHHFTAPTTEA